MKKITEIIIIIILFFIYSGTVMADSVITPERFREFVEWKLNESDDNLKEVIKHNNITEEKISNLKGLSKNYFINCALDPAYIKRFTYLFEADTFEPEDHYLDPFQVLYVATYNNFGVSTESVLIDLESGKYYIDPAHYCFENVDECEIKGNLTDTQLAFIQTLIGNTPWNDFQYLYPGSDEPNFLLDGADWMLAIETPDGIIRYKVEATSEGGPAELINFGQKIIDYLL